MKNFIFIPCHLNHQYKIDNLNKILDVFNNEYLVVGSHYQIPDEIKKKCDFFFVEKENAIVGFDEFSKFGKIQCHLSCNGLRISKYIPYTGYAHMSLFKNAYLISIGKKFKNFYHINYDINTKNFDNVKMSEIDELLTTYDSVFYEWMGHKDRYDSNFFAFKKNDQIECLLKMRDFSEWDDQKFGFSTEQFLYDGFLKYKNYVFELKDRLDLYDSIDSLNSGILSYQHPYASKKVRPILLFKNSNDLTLDMVLHNEADISCNVKIIINENIICKDIMLQPKTYHIFPVCENDQSDHIIKILIDNVVVNVFDANDQRNQAEIFQE